MTARAWRGVVGAAAAMGLVVRVAYVLGANRTVPGLSDSRWYHWAANGLADGHGYVRPYELHGDPSRVVPTADFPPLLPLLLAGPSRLGLDGVVAHKLVLCGVGTVTVVAVALLGRRVGGPLVGAVAAWVAALHPALWSLDASLMAESPYVLLVTLAVLAALVAAGSPAWRPHAALGALLGLAVLTRSDGAALVPLLALPAAWAGGGRHARAATRAAGVALLAAAVVVAPWTVRNALVMDGIVLGGNNSGGAIAGANCDAVYHGPTAGLWDLGCVWAAEDRRPEVTGETEKAAMLRRAGAAYARDHAGELPRVLALRVLRTWGLWSTDVQVAYEASETRDRAVVVATRWASLGLGAFAVAGAVVLRRRRDRVWPLGAGVVAATATALATYGNQRFRAVAEPSLVVLAAVAVVAVATALAGRRAVPADGAEPEAGSRPAVPGAPEVVR